MVKDCYTCKYAIRPITSEPCDKCTSKLTAPYEYYEPIEMEGDKNDNG